ncbi:hypothetical protein Rhe02_54000 [Rhizocola hellebori]|uniref:Uncharacterized protein n=1 Tax=Rhizocola hellebori TaxID=1392758 RepID=A0A8J3VIV8_9ACTN|nr:hypothetical protein [Rhizocola hellebori]GIH07333.1 hypothetical protein Rhe02_54000 [Rhizocola hellebori]
MRRAQLGGGLFIGCTLLGVGIGMLFDRVAPGALIGVGVGFVLTAILSGFSR